MADSAISQLTPIKSTPVHWRQSETEIVVYRSALLMIDNGYSFAKAVIQTQTNWLPPERQRPRTSLETSIGRFKPLINAEIARIRAERAKLRNDHATIPPVGQPISAVVVAPAAAMAIEAVKSAPIETALPSVQEQIYRTAQNLADVVLDLFEPMLIRGLAARMPDLIPEIRAEALRNFEPAMAEGLTEFNAKLKMMPKKSIDFPSLPIPGAIVQGPVIKKLKVVYLDSGEHKKDQPVVTAGLLDRVKFTFLNNVAGCGSVAEADVVIRGKYCSKELYAVAKGINRHCTWLQDLTANGANSAIRMLLANAQAKADQANDPDAQPTSPNAHLPRSLKVV